MPLQHPSARGLKSASYSATPILLCAVLLAALCSPCEAAANPSGQGKFKPGGTKAEAGGGVRPLVLDCANQTTLINSGDTVNGTLQQGDCANPLDGSFYDAYSFTGAAGQQVTIDMTSTAFDTYLYLMRPGETTISPDPNVTVQDDDGGGGTNARISITLPSDGTYTILADSYGTGVTPGGTGNYTLTMTLATPFTLRIDSVAPSAGRASGGQQIKLTGAFAGLSSVTVGGVAASWSYSNGTTEITVTTPAHAVGAVSITVTPSVGSDYTKPNAFAYLPTTFTDDTLVAGVTTAKGLHVVELRQAVDALRAVAGLAPAVWTDATLTPGATVIKAAHVAELRVKLEEAAAALGYPSATYTDPSLGGLVIKRVHIEELRQRIRNIAG